MIIACHASGYFGGVTVVRATSGKSVCAQRGVEGVVISWMGTANFFATGGRCPVPAFDRSDHMSVFGMEISMLVLLQVLVTVLAVGLFSIITSLEEAKADHLGESQTILLVSFLLDYHPALKSLAQIAEAKVEDVDDRNNEVYWTNARLTSLREKGVLPTLTQAAQTNLAEHLLFLVLAPVSAMAVLALEVGEARKYKAHRVYHTEIRRNRMSKGLILVFGNSAILLAGAVVWSKVSHWVGIALVAAAVIGGLLSGAFLALHVWWQLSWKDYWQEKLLEVMALATKDGNHDLCNRSLILKSEIERQPDVPIPGGLGFYVSLYSAVQGLLLILHRIVGL